MPPIHVKLYVENSYFSSGTLRYMKSHIHTEKQMCELIPFIIDFKAKTNYMRSISSFWMSKLFYEKISWSKHDFGVGFIIFPTATSKVNQFLSNLHNKWYSCGKALNKFTTFSALVDIYGQRLLHELSSSTSTTKIWQGLHQNNSRCHETIMFRIAMRRRDASMLCEFIFLWFPILLIFIFSLQSSLCYTEHTD